MEPTSDPPGRPSPPPGRPADRGAGADEAAGAPQVLRLRLFGHPLHPALVHFPMALLGTSLLFDLGGILSGRPIFWAIAFWNIALGLVIAPFTATTGLLDSLQVRKGSPAAPILNLHLSLMLGAVAFYASALAVRGGASPPAGGKLFGTLALEVLGLLLLLVGGWAGGQLVHHYRVGSVE